MYMFTFICINVFEKVYSKTNLVAPWGRRQNIGIYRTSTSKSERKENLNKLKTSNILDLVVANLPSKETPGTDGYLGKVY